MQWLEQPAVKWAIPLPLLAAVAPIIWAFFRRTWRELDEEAFQYRLTLHERGELDYRPLVALTLGALVLIFQEYYGRGDTYVDLVRPWIEAREKAHPGGFWDVGTYDELYLRAWWALTRVGGYLAPLVVWRLFFRHDSLLDFGLRPHGFREHAWIYALCVVFMVPILLVVSRQGDFVNYYPLYKEAGRSWLDYLVWEALYIAQFITLEIFFRGWWIRATRVFGVGAIWSMVVPYVMIHFGKPYLEACSAMVAGVILGSLSMRTRSIYAGFLVHGTVAVLMDVLSLYRRNALPVLWAPGSSRHVTFLHWDALIWIAWTLAFAVVAVKLWHVWRQRRAAVPPGVAALVLLGAGLALASGACGGPTMPAGATGGAGTGAAGTGGAQTRGLSVSGNQLVDGAGRAVRLLGVNRAGTEYMCATATVKSVFDGPTDDATIDAMLSWHINTVRLPLNESCWLGINGATDVGGDFYRTLIQEYVDRLHARGLYVVLDLHWTAAGAGLAKDQRAMADADHAIELWRSVATTFKSDPMVLFDLFNEPYLDLAGAGDAWGCWLSGCNVQGYASAGMQAMLDAVRGTGAKQVVIASGLSYANKLDGWLAHKPVDPTGNLMAGFHLYNDGTCGNAGCWTSTVGAVAQQVPVVTGELGQRDCGHGFIDGYMSWADGHGVGYLGWAWNPVDCAGFPALISDWGGAPTTFGLGLQTHLAQVNP